MKTVSLEMAKRLKEKGYPQEKNTFYWVITLTTNYHISYVEGDMDLLPKERNDFLAAPTIDEILEELPIYFDCKSNSHRYHMNIHPNFDGEENEKEIKDWIIGYKMLEAFGGDWHEKNPFGDRNLADAAAKVWLYIRKKELI